MADRIVAALPDFQVGRTAAGRRGSRGAAGALLLPQRAGTDGMYVLTLRHRG